MVQIDVPVAFGIGSFFADAANRQLASGRAEYYYRAFAANNIFQIFFFSWIPVYFIANYFGWETTHMWWTADSAAAYPLFIPIFMVLFFGMANLGFLLGAWLVRKGRLGINRAVYLAVLTYAGLWVFAQYNRTAKLGTYSEYHANPTGTPWFYQDPTFLTMFIISMVAWAVPLALFALRLRNEGKHLDILYKAAGQ